MPPRDIAEAFKMMGNLGLALVHIFKSVDVEVLEHEKMEELWIEVSTG